MRVFPDIRSSIKYFLILTIGIVAVYAQTLTFDFVNYDDPELVRDNSAFLSDPSNIARSFTTHAFTSHRTESVYYRPLLLVSYIVDYQIWKTNPMGYHLTNIILHILASILVFLLAELIFKEPILSLVIGLVFALHPVQVESVAWIAGRNDILLTLFVLLMLLFYHAYRTAEKYRQRYLFFSILAFTAALFTKESAAFFILLLPLHNRWLRREGKFLLPHWRVVSSYAWFFIVLAFYLFIRFQIFGSMIGAEKLYGKVPPISRIELIPAFIMENLRLMILPIRLSIDHPLDKVLWTETPWIWISLFSIVLLITLAWWQRRKAITFTYGMTWIGIGLLPTLNIFPMAIPIFEHRLYIVLVGFSLGMVTLLQQARIFSDRTWTAIFFTVTVIAAILSYNRIPVWQNSEHLWMDAIEKTPSGSRPYMGIASYYIERGAYAQSIPVLEKYIVLRPDDPDGYGKLRQAYYVTGKRPEAAQLSRELVMLQPREPTRYLEAGILYDELHASDTALEFYRQGLALDPENFEMTFRLAIAYDRIQQPDSAEFYYRSSLHLNRNLEAVYLSLGQLYIRRARITSAVAVLQDGLAFVQPSREYLQTLSEIYQTLGQDEQIRILRQRYTF
jgi:protein O-mannosyl-transferase